MKKTGPEPEKSTQKTMLHVGCGQLRINRTTPGFRDGSWREIRLDIDPSVKPDIIGSMTDMSAVKDRSVDAIFSSHNIEHLFPHEVPTALREFLRVLTDEGYCVIVCPDLQMACKLVAEDKLTEAAYVSSSGPITPLDILFGHGASIAKGHRYMAHHGGFTEKSLSRALINAGFASLATMRRGFDLWALATKRPRTDVEIRDVAQRHFPVGPAPGFNNPEPPSGANA